MYTIRHTAEDCPGRPCADGCDHVEFKRGPKPYNGHHCWNCWNVSLWISNDEGLYRLALDCIRRPRANGKPVSASIAANRFAESSGLTRTPDGARYTFKAVRACMVRLGEGEQVMPEDDEGRRVCKVCQGWIDEDSESGICFACWYDSSGLSGPSQEPAEGEED